MDGGAKPTRTCVACRRRKPKSELLRICRPKDGIVSVDTTGKKPGRGCYVCLDGACVTNAGLKGSLKRGLRVEVPESVLEELEGYRKRVAGNGPTERPRAGGDAF